MKRITLIVIFCAASLWGCVSDDDVVRFDLRLTTIERQNNQLEARYKNLQSQLQENVQKTEQLTAKLAQQFETYSKGRSNEDQNLRTQAAELRTALDEIREQLRLMNGRLEETAFVLKQQLEKAEASGQNRETELERLSMASTAMQARLDRISEYLNLETKALPLPKTPTSGPAEAPGVPQPVTEEGLYQAAKAAFDEGNLKLARENFETFLKNYPKSGQADNAQFWIGETYYREKWYEKAILEYQKVIENYPRGNKVRASLLKQGLAFEMLGDNANASLILNELVKKYPDSAEAKIARKKLQGIKS